MKEKIELNIWGEGNGDFIFLGKRARERRNKQRELIIEVLQNVAPDRPTRDELQKLAGIRREPFIKVLKRLMDKGEVFRYGTGVRGDPFTFGFKGEIK